MSFFSGRHGSLVYLGKPVAKVSSWQLTLSTDLLETTTVEQFAPTYRPGMKSATGSAQLFYYRLEFRDRTENTSFVELLNKLVRVGELGKPTGYHWIWGLDHPRQIACWWMPT